MDEFAMRALEHLKKLVSIPSASGNENEVAEYCYRTVEAAGFRAEKIPTDDGRFVVYAEMQGGRPGKTLLFSGHIDTVPVVGGWDTDPHTAVLKTVGGEERLYGLGASDIWAARGPTLSPACSRWPSSPTRRPIPSARVRS